jgi:RNA polymerase sigma-70 factor (sigma-E family)
MRRGAEEFDERFAAFVRSRGEHHLRIATLLTGSPDAAGDLMQASLLKLYRAWPRIDTRGEPDAYLRRIMVNTRRSWWRVRWRQETPMSELPEAAGEDTAERRAVGALVRQALGQLPKQQRAVLVLRYCEDLPEAEVASLLGCSVGAVKTHAHRGRLALRGLLCDLDPDAVNEMSVGRVDEATVRNGGHHGRRSHGGDLRGPATAGDGV